MPLYTNVRSSSQRRAGGMYAAMSAYAWQSSTVLHPSRNAPAAAARARCTAIVYTCGFAV